jgi:hypothetical protein
MVDQARRGVCLAALGSALHPGRSLLALAVPSLAAGSSQAPPRFSVPWPRPLARFDAGIPAALDLAGVLQALPGTGWRVRARADLHTDPQAARRLSTHLPFDSQFPEYRLEGSWLKHDGSAAGAVAAGASAARVQLEVTAGDFEDRGGVLVSDIAWIVVDTPLARIRHGLDSWSDFGALTRAVHGDAQPGSASRGRTDLIGSTFEVTPGMFSEGHQSRIGSPVAVIEFPCTVKAADLARRPVLRSVSGRRDIVQIQAQQMPPIDGEVVLQDLVIRDNRAWYDSGEAGVRIKDRFPGRSVRIERCEFVRCQNAVAGGGTAQTLRIVDCRIVDCGHGDQAHGLYVQPGLLEFHGNVVTYSPDNRLARAHMVKSRALVSRILGNHVTMNDAPVSFLLDLSNGGDCEVGGNVLHHGRRSDNTGATLIAYAPEGAGADSGRQPPAFLPGRRFRLVVRNNTLLSDFAAPTRFVVADDHEGLRAEGGRARSFPDPLVVADNVYWSAGPATLVTRRDRRFPGMADLSVQHANNTRLADRPAPMPPRAPLAPALLPRNASGPYTSRRFTGHTYLGTGSVAVVFEHHGAG